MNIKKRKAAIGALVTWFVGTPCLAQFPERVRESDLDGQAGFQIHGVSLDESISAAASIGDVNADGVADLGASTLSAPVACLPDAPCLPFSGYVYAIFGRPDIAEGGDWTVADLDGSNGFVIPGPYDWNSIGNIAAAGDFNDDGTDDFMFTAAASSAPGPGLSGEIFVIHGREGLGADEAPFDLTSLGGSDGFRIWGESVGGAVGARLNHIGDFNGDGVSDIATSSMTADPGGRTGAGQVYVLYGGKGLGESGVVSVPSSLTPATGLIINGISPGDYLGAHVRSTGDFNGDGIDDLVLRAAFAEHAPRSMSSTAARRGHRRACSNWATWTAATAFSSTARSARLPRPPIVRSVYDFALPPAWATSTWTATTISPL